MATERKNKQLSVSLSPEKFAALDNWGWDNRIRKTNEVLAIAVDEFITNHNLTVAAEPEDTPAEDAPVKGK